MLPRCQCVYTHKAGGKPALAAELEEFRKKTKFYGKNKMFNEHPAFVYTLDGNGMKRGGMLGKLREGMKGG